MRIPNILGRLRHMHKWVIIDSCRGYDKQTEKKTGKELEEPRTIILVQCEVCGDIKTRKIDGFFKKLGGYI